MQFQKSTTYRLKKKQSGFTPAEELKPKKSKTAPNVDGDKTIIPKEFIWDRMVTVLVTCILGLTVVDLIAEFFSQSTSTVVCRTPSSFSAVQSSFVNSFCFSSLSLAQYYPLFLAIHGLVILSPHQFWSWLFSGHIDFFFDLAKTLDRLKDPSSGEYDRKNIAIVTKLEGEFSSCRSMHRCYVGKLILQMVAAALSLCISWGVFDDFSITFLCSRNASSQRGAGNDSFDDAWPTYFECTYIPFRLFSVLRYVDAVLIIAVIVVLLYGVIWYVKGHSAELGTNEIAMFAFTSCLPPESYVFPKLCSAAGACQLKILFSPPIKNDLDFLLLRLYQSDSGHGKVFRELQISKAYRSLHTHDHKLLHLLLNLQQDWRDAMKTRLQRCNNYPCNGIEGGVSDTKEHLHLELQEYFRRSIGVYKNPELEAYEDYKEDLGNIDLNGLEWVAIQSIRAAFYEFVKCAPHLVIDGVEAGYALDVSFGTSGFTLALARAFEKVRSVNFHPFYQDDMPKRTAFYTNYDCIMLSQDVFSRSNIVLNKTYEFICEEISHKKVLNFIVVGPIDDKSKLATVNLLISHLLAAGCIQANAMLLTVRPLQIAHRSTSETYFNYEPSMQDQLQLAESIYLGMFFNFETIAMFLLSYVLEFFRRSRDLARSKKYWSCERLGSILVPTLCACAHFVIQKKKKKTLISMDNGAQQFYQLAEQKLQKSGLITRPPAQHQNIPRGKLDIQPSAQKHLQPKEFVWDRSVTLLVAGILSLTSVYLVVEFFRRPSSAVICHVPNNFTASQFAYINSFCSSGVSLTQYYPIFITLQGLLISAPHQLWFWTFGGYTKYFVDLATTLDRFHNIRSGKHREANVAIVTKLEKEFSNSKIIFLGYVGKLFVQLAFTAMAIVITLAVFDDFTVLFQCSRNTYALYKEGNLPFLAAGPISFECLYTPLQFLSVLRYLNIILQFMVITVLLVGIQWSFFGHPNELGAKKLAHFTFHLCLPALQVKLIFDGWFSPRIEYDLDFLLMQLYQVDTGYGQVFRELQIDKEFQYINAKDHKLLQSFNDMQMDIRDYEQGKCPDLSITDVKNEADNLFKQATGFDEKLSSSSTLPIKGTLRSQLLEFVYYALNKEGLVIDISFGTTGFGRSLAWAFRQAVTICFHGLHNKQKPQKETFYTNHFSVNLPQENFSWNTSKASACLEKELEGRNSDLCLIFVGPLDDQSKVTTVHVLINMLLKSKYLNIVNGAILLTVRPIRIGRTEIADQYFRYKPSKHVFGYLNIHGGKEEDVVHTETNCVVHTETNCAFEFYAYKFISHK